MFNSRVNHAHTNCQ